MNSLLVVTRSIPLHDGAGGMEAVAWDLAARLADRCEVEVLTTKVPGQVEYFQHDGVNVHALQDTAAGRYSWTWWFKTAQIGRCTRADTVLSVSAGATAMVWRRSKRTRYVLQAHGTTLAELRGLVRSRAVIRRPYRLLRSICWLLIDVATYARFDDVVCTSEHVRSTLLKWPYARLWTRTDLNLVVNGIPDEVNPTVAEIMNSRRARGYSPKDHVAICVARLERQKGVDQCLAAIAAADCNIKLLIVGDGPQGDALRRRVEDLGLQERVVFTGSVSRAAARELMRLADVFVFPVRNGIREGLPLSVLEALGAGLAVVAAREARWPADLENLLDRVDARDPLALASAIHGAHRFGHDRLPSRFRLDSATRDYYKLLFPQCAGMR